MRDKYIVDTRIHCALFFINPTGHSLRPIDIIVMKKLSEVVNVVPVIAKSDSLTIEERDNFKSKVSPIHQVICREINPTNDLPFPHNRSAPSLSTTTSAYTPSTLTSSTKTN
jgi:septin family protein